MTGMPAWQHRMSPDARRCLGGVLPNSPENMVEWLKRPQHFSPLSAMPDLGVPDGDARDMTAYLFTLR